MTSKQGALIQTLLEQNQQLSAAQLAQQLGVSVRTVHNYINSVNAQYPGAIVSTPRGYQIMPQLARKALNQDSNPIPQTAQERCTYILNRLIQSGGSLNLLDLCEEIFISTTTFQSLLGKIRRIIRDYDLALTVSSEIVTLEGRERNKRRLLSSLLYGESSAAFTSMDGLQAAFPFIDIEQIRDNLMEVFEEYHYFINDYSMLNLLLHVAIAINRVQNGCITSDTDFDTSRLASHEQDLARQVIQQLESIYHLSFSPAESYEMALLLVSRASALDYETITTENISLYIGNNCLTLVNQLITAVQDSYGINLNEPEFFVRFALHIHNLLLRASNKAFCKNPLVDEIRQTCPLIYDVSVQLSGIIWENTGIVIDEDEIAYIALHLGGALETQKELSRRIPTVLYCPSYYNMDSNLSERINRKLGAQIVLNNVFTDEKDLENLHSGQLVISTVRLHRIYDFPLVIISPFLTNTDCISINRKVEEINLDARKRLFRKNLESLLTPNLFECGSELYTRDNTIHYICNRLYEMGYTEPNYEQGIMERESMSSTAFGQFAIPHQLKMVWAKHSGMFVYQSRTPIQWNDTAVNLVIMLCFSRDERKVFYNVFEPLSMILLDSNNVKALLNCHDYSAFIDFLVDHME